MGKKRPEKSLSQNAFDTIRRMNLHYGNGEVKSVNSYDGEFGVVNVRIPITARTYSVTKRKFRVKEGKVTFRGQTRRIGYTPR